MIVVRAPLRISFLGGGTDFPDFYRRHPGRVVSTTINKFVYVVVNRTPLINKVSARYSISETVSHPRELQHTRLREALLDLGILNQIEIASFASVPAKTGLGSSSSFSVALLKALYTYQRQHTDQAQIAEAASRLEIELVGEPIGKQDQYAASFGGFNTFQFNPDGSVEVEPILLDYKKRAELESHLLLFFSGISQDARSALTERQASTEERLRTLRETAEAALEFKDCLLAGNLRRIGDMLQQGWLQKETPASETAGNVIDALYQAGLHAGGWGGKVLGAGGGGCLLFVAPPERHQEIREALQRVARDRDLGDFQELPVKFVQSGAEVLFNGDHHHTMLL